MKEQDFSATQYEKKYKEGYGLVYPDAHIIRIHKHILDWELHMAGGRVFDFGCGSGAHLKYFADHGYEPSGCDVSATAIERCKALMPKYAANFSVTPAVKPDLSKLAAPGTVDVFLSNQVLYYLDNAGIRDIAGQAHAMLRKGGVFVVTMMSYSCWYARYIVGRKGEFEEVDMRTPRQTERMFINFKNREDLEPLFKPFRKLHIGSYGNHVREEEGSTDHWIFVGVRD